MSLGITDIAVCILAFLLYVELRNRRLYKSLPPGPKRLPLIGNILQVPTSLEWEVYARWGKELNSDMIHLAVGGTSLLCCHFGTTCSLKLVHELCELGYATPSFTSKCLEELDPKIDTKHQTELIRNTAGVIYAAASHTIVSSIYTFFIAMLHYPDVMKKAHAELDSVIGSSRLPDFNDRTRTPYISAIVKEVLRWQPAAPQGFPHRLMEDDVYEGYSFPAGTIFLANSWAMLHDEKDYPDPMTFKPERFLNSKGEMNPEICNPSDMAFGYGRRICAGAHVAEAALWLTIASVLSTFDISPPVDEKGNAILPSLVYQSNVVSNPLPFDCNFKPRSKEAEFVIRSAAVI